jgi:hypothetical protein
MNDLRFKSVPRTRVISIRSRDRINGSSSISDFKVTIERISNVRNVKIQNVIIPLSYYNINSLNNSITFNDGVLRTATLTLGSYTANQLATMIQTAMNAISTLVFTITYNSITQKFTISSTSNFSLIFTIQTSLLPVMLGFNYTTYSGASTYTSVNVASVNKIYSQLNICSGRLSLHNQQVSSSSTFFGNLICVINNSIYKPGEYLYYSNDDNSQNVMFSNEASSLDNIDIRIYDGDNNLIEFNGVDEVCINLIVTYHP